MDKTNITENSRSKRSNRSPYKNFMNRPIDRKADSTRDIIEFNAAKLITSNLMNSTFHSVSNVRILEVNFSIRQKSEDQIPKARFIEFS